MNRSNTLWLVAVSISSMLIAVPCEAQYLGPKNFERSTTISKARAQPDGRPVILRGRLRAKVADERYVFTDDTGEIIVEIDDEDMPAVDAGDTVELHGEVDTHAFRPSEIEVKWVKVISL